MDQGTKDKIQYTTAVVTLASGIAMCYLAYFIGDMKDIPSGALWYFGQTIVYAGTIFGFKLVADDILKRNNR